MYAENELYINTREQKLSGKSQFVVLVQGCEIAFLERYDYSLEETGTLAHNCIVPLTKPVYLITGI